MAQRTSVKAVSDGLARQLGRMVEDAVRSYSGGSPKAELAKGHTDFVQRFHKLLDELADERAQTLVVAEWPPWKTIQLGTHKSVEELRKALIDNRFKIGSWGDDILKKIPLALARKPAEIELFLLSGNNLGLPNGGTRKQFFENASKLGFAPCPAEVGPQLRLQYKDQPAGEWILVAMEPISDSVGNLRVFDVEHDSAGLWLDGSSGSPVYFWGAGVRWVFRRK